MDFNWITFAFGDVAWLLLAFALGFLSRSVGLPPMVGFLAAGFLLNTQGIAGGDALQKLADLGIILLLFTVGLKLKPRTLVRPHVWAVAGMHMSIIVTVFGLAIYWLAMVGVPFVSGMDMQRSLFVAFALSFSSTVFVVQALEDKGQMKSVHGGIAIGILIMQDLAAVIFLAVSVGKVPSLWAALLFLLIPLRPLLHQVLTRVGHGELLVLFGFLLAMGGAEVFELVGLKAALGALLFGVLIANHPRSQEMAKTMLGFKDLFLLAFFLSVGLSGQLTTQTLIVAAALVPFVFLKSVLFFALLARFKLRARTSLLTTLHLTNYSEFGLIVAALGVANGWLDNDWLIVIAVALSLSFVVAAALDGIADRLYSRYRKFWRRLQSSERLADDMLVDMGGATIAVIGMGRVGTSAYDNMRSLYGETVVGIDTDSAKVRQHQSTGRRVLVGDPSGADFWDRVAETHTIELVMLALPRLETNLSVLDQLGVARFPGRVAATARFADEIETLKQAGATTVFNIYTEAGTGFAHHVVAEMPD